MSAASVSHGSLICGDRGGTIHVYQLGSEFVSTFNKGCMSIDQITSIPYDTLEDNLQY